MRRAKGIDISHWNQVTDFTQVKVSGYEFVILKAGGSDYGFYKDVKFDEYYEKAKAAGLLVGAYYFVGKKFYGTESGVADAKRFIELIKGKDLDLPVFVDIETTDKRFKKEATEAATAFCETMKVAGYIPGIYASDISGYKERLDITELAQYVLWVARYNNLEPSYVKDWDLWQLSSKGMIPGISGSVDLNVIKLKDEPKVTKKGTRKKKSEDQ